MKAESIFDANQFLKVCDSINMVNTKGVRIFWESFTGSNFDTIFNTKREAKDYLYKLIGSPIYNLHVFN